MRTLWNEGRVVGLSAYEIFVRHILGKNPAAVVPSEQAWLASMLSNGSSMLLQVGVDNIDGSHYIEIDMPVTSELWAANTIVGSFFLGTGAGSGTTTSWCDRVTDYGPLIQNDSEHSPEGGVIPPTDRTVSISDTVRDQLREYAKIVDGIDDRNLEADLASGQFGTVTDNDLEYMILAFLGVEIKRESSCAVKERHHFFSCRIYVCCNIGKNTVVHTDHYIL